MDEQEQENEVQEEQNVQMEPTPVSSPPSHKKLIIGIVAVFVLVAGMAGAYFLFQPKAQPIDDTQPVSAEAGAEVSNWETYRSSQFGYEFKYPNEWLIEETDGQVKVVLPDTTISPNVVASRNMIFVAIDYSEFGELGGTDELKKQIEENKDGDIAGVPRVMSVNIETDTSYRKVIEFFHGEIFYSVNSLYGLKRSIAIENMNLDNIKEDQQNTLLLQEKVISTFKFIETPVSNNTNLNCRETQCSNNITEVCCDCEVDGPFYYIKTDTKENIANCERGTDDSKLCSELSSSCF